MPLLRTIHDDAVRADVLRRLDRLAPETPRRWGRMNAHQMVCHLADLFRFGMGERDGPALGSRLHHTLVKWWAVTVPLRWPHGFPTARQFDQEREGTPPDVFEADLADLIDLIHRFSDPLTPLDTHPLFGPLKRSEWGRWGFRHVDHHLRQFGL